jgi:hypothetical protein
MSPDQKFELIRLAIGGAVLVALCFVWRSVMKYWVLMGNDFPEAIICGTEAEAEAYRDKIKARESNPRIHWRLYSFDLITYPWP